jgi:hypothetical protein
MKDFFCLVTFAAGALGFAVFFATLKPAVIVTASAKADCQTGHPGAHACGFDGPAGFSAAGLRRFVRY